MRRPKHGRARSSAPPRAPGAALAAAGAALAALLASGAGLLGQSLLRPGGALPPPAGAGARLLGRQRLPRRAVALQALGEGGDAEEELADDGTSLELFRQQLIRNFDGGAAIGGATDGVRWASCVPDSDDAGPGDLLLANPSKFVQNAARAGAGEMGSVGGLSGVALKAMSLLGIGAQGVSRDLPRRDRGRLMPVVLLLRRNEDGSGEGLSLTTRTGMLLGDYDMFSEFMIRPLHDGGPEKAGLLWIHPYPQVENSKRLGNSELYAAGDKESAQQWVGDEGQGSSLRFRFFVNRVRWGKGELTGDINDGAWIPVRCSPEFVLDEGGEIGTKPLWIDVAEAAGGRAEEAGREADLL